MSYQPVSGIVPQYSDDSNQLASGFYVKFYIANTTTPLSMATDSTGGTLLTKAKLNPDGLPISNPADNTTVFIPHVDQDYRLVIYRNEADANANNTAGAFLNVPKVEPLTGNTISTSTSTQTLAVALDDRVVTATSIADMKTKDAAVGQIIELAAGGRSGTFEVKSGTPPADSQEGVYVVLANGNYAERNFSGLVNAAWFGLIDDDAVSQEVKIQAALDYSKSNGSSKREVIIPSGYNIKWSVVNVPAGVTLWAVGCEIETTAKPGITVNPRSKVYGFGSRLIDQTDNIPAQIEALDKNVTNNEIEILGFEMFATGGAKTGRAIDISTLYQSKIDVTVSGYDIQYYETGVRACYYNQINISLTNTNQGLLSTGDLFNGNEITITRCNADLRGVRLGGTGNTLTVKWIEKVSQRGIYLIGASGTTIVGGAIEGGVGAIAAIEMATGTTGTTILGTKFGGEFSNSGKRVIASGSTEGTTLICEDEIFLNFSGAITTVGGGTGKRVNTGSIRASEPVVVQKYTVAGLPSASTYNGGFVIVTDDIGGQISAFSDGVNWRRTSDRAIISAT